MKKMTWLWIAFFAFIPFLKGQDNQYQLSSHILDITTGQPAPNVLITLSKKGQNEQWVKIEEKKTDVNGRIKDFLKQDGTKHTGIYKLTFHTAPYFENLNQKSFYPLIEVADQQHYHVPITLSPFGYSTYRGN